MHALLVTRDHRGGRFYCEHGAVVVANGPSDLWRLRLLASSLRNESGAEVYEMELPGSWQGEVIHVRNVA
jgi:hypothetical protein